MAVDLTKNYTLNNNIDATATKGTNASDMWSTQGFNPIGNAITPFTGKFDGLGHTISNLNINRPSTNYVGLFGYSTGASIRNIGLLGGSVTGASIVGGLEGYNGSGTVENSYATGTVKGNDFVGGLVGYNYNNSSIENVYATGSVTGTSLVGGLVGYNNYATVENSYATGNVTSTDTHSSAFGTGGLVGSNTGTIRDAYATGTITGSGSNIGGLVGYNLGLSAKIENSYATGNVTGGHRTGGLVGRNSGGGTITYAYATGNVATIGSHDAGGLVGINEIGTVSNVYATGNVTGSDDSIGGLVGYNGGAISNAYSTGTASGTGTNNNYVGGLVGYHAGGSITNAYSTGAATGTNNVGGLTGTNGGTITNAYATGKVTGASNVGGLIGSGNTVTNSYWNTETTGQANSAGGTGLTTEQMFDKANFAGFDFVNIWNNANNQTTPYLKNHLGLNSVFNKNDLPTGAINPTNRPALYNVIQTLDQLQGVNNNLSGKYVLGNNIDAAATATWNHNGTIYNGFNPLGRYVYNDSSKSFTGKFDGLNFVISDLYINRSSTDYVGLFGYSSGATIQNVGLLGGSVTGQYYVGGLVGYNTNNSSIENAYAIGSVTGTSFVGGLVG